MSSILATQLIFGLMFVVRTVRTLKLDPIINANHLTKIGTAVICSQIFVAFVLFHHKAFAIIAIFGCCMAFIFTVRWSKKRMQRQLNEEFLWYIEDLLLNLKLSQGIHQASKNALASRSALFQRFISRLQESHILEITPAFAGGFLSAHHLLELKNALSSSHLALKRLSALRSDLDMESDFRRRSGQAQLQARSQSYILWGLYLALSSFVIAKCGWREAQKFVLISLFAFIIGHWLFIRFARKVTWNL